MSATIESITINGDTAKVVVAINGLSSEIRSYDIARSVQDGVYNVLVKDIANKWMLENGADFYKRIDANQVLNAVILKTAGLAAGVK